MDIRLKTAPYTFDGLEMTLCCNMNVLADVQEYFDGSFGRALEKRRTLKANIVFLTAMINDYLDSIGSTKRYEVREVGRKLPTSPRRNAGTERHDNLPRKLRIAAKG